MLRNGNNGGVKQSEGAGTPAFQGSQTGDGGTDGVLTPSEELRT